MRTDRLALHLSIPLFHVNNFKTRIHECRCGSRVVLGMSYLRSLGRCDHEFESHFGHGRFVYVSILCVFVLSCV
jgi:hypothetical protein